MHTCLVLTIGHSTHTLQEFIAILKANNIKVVVDVRTIPKSRHNPQFNSASFSKALAKEHIFYVHVPELGGLRHAKKDSINTAWRNASFRGYADYMQTPEFEEALKKLIILACKTQVVIMCAEAVPWRCHRSLIGDALLAHNIAVEDIINNTRKEHKLTPWAKITGTQVTYPGS